MADAGKVLATTIYTVRPESPVSEAVSLMVSRGVGDVIVVEYHKPIGILTDRDVMVRVTAPGLDPKNVQARTVMSWPLVTVKKDLEVGAAVALMARHGFRRLPIVDEEGRLFSMLTLDDILLLRQDSNREAAEIVRRQLTPGRGSKERSPEAGGNALSGAVGTIGRATVMPPMDRSDLPPELPSAKGRPRRDWKWMMIAAVVAILGAVAALIAATFFGAFYSYNPQYYEPKDIQREPFVTKPEPARQGQEQPGQ
jgi:CBS domain-containing protein